MVHSNDGHNRSSSASTNNGANYEFWRQGALILRSLLEGRSVSAIIRSGMDIDASKFILEMSKIKVNLNKNNLSLSL